MVVIHIVLSFLVGVGGLRVGIVTTGVTVVTSRDLW